MEFTITKPIDENDALHTSNSLLTMERSEKDFLLEGNILKAPNNEVLYFFGSFTSPTRIFPFLLDILPIFQNIKQNFVQIPKSK